MASATSIAPVGGFTDDSATALAALPFPFTFFGSPVTTYSASSNGALSFTSLITTQLGTTIPRAAFPNNFVAVFWDDLNVNLASRVKVLTIGAAPTRRFVVEWSGFGFLAGGGIGAERLTFQVKLFEDTNVVELHYCALQDNGGSISRVSGSEATVGLENSTGLVGLQHSADMANSVSTTTALRFVPAP